MNERFLTTAEVAGMLHVSPKTVTRWARTGRLPHQFTLGGHRRYPETRIREIVKSLVVEEREHRGAA